MVVEPEHSAHGNYDEQMSNQTGYVMNFGGRGAFSPDGKVEMTVDEIREHNRKVAADECLYLRTVGRGVLYLTPDASGNWFVTQWTDGLRIPAYNIRKSWHNMAGKDGRTDVDFSFDGSRWHGVNIGDNQMLRVKRCKS